jgi:hypothetical protein
VKLLLFATAAVYAEEVGNYEKINCDAVMLTNTGDFNYKDPKNADLLKSFVINFEFLMSSVTRTFP